MPGIFLVYLIRVLKNVFSLTWIHVFWFGLYCAYFTLL
jgi:hypothetical protein